MALFYLDVSICIRLNSWTTLLDNLPNIIINSMKHKLVVLLTLLSTILLNIIINLNDTKLSVPDECMIKKRNCKHAYLC